MRHSDLQVWLCHSGGTPVIVAKGEIDLGSVDILRALTSEVVSQQPASVIFDFRDVTFIDSSGLGILVATRRLLKNAPGCVVVVTKQPAVLQTLALTGLNQVFPVWRELENETSAQEDADPETTSTCTSYPR